MKTYKSLALLGKLVAANKLVTFLSLVQILFAFGLLAVLPKLFILALSMSPLDSFLSLFAYAGSALGLGLLFSCLAVLTANLALRVSFSRWFSWLSKPSDDLKNDPRWLFKLCFFIGTFLIESPSVVSLTSVSVGKYRWSGIGTGRTETEDTY